MTRNQIGAGTATLTVSTTPSADWADFVTKQSDGTIYHGLPWIGVAIEAFGCQAYFVEARSCNGDLVGVLPVVRQRSLLFGDRLTSLPYCNYGGPVASQHGIAERLMDSAVRLAVDIGVDCMEIRDCSPRVCLLYTSDAADE